MNAKVKKILSYIGTFIAGAASLLLYFKFSKRYLSVRRELQNASDNLTGAIDRLTDVEAAQSELSEQNTGLREVLCRERELIAETRANLTDDAAVLDRAQERLALCQSILAECSAGSQARTE